MHLSFDLYSSCISGGGLLFWRVSVYRFSRQLSFLGGLFRGFAPEEIEEDSWKYASSMTPPSLTVTRLAPFPDFLPR